MIRLSWVTAFMAFWTVIIVGLSSESPSSDTFKSQQAIPSNTPSSFASEPEIKQRLTERRTNVDFSSIVKMQSVPNELSSTTTSAESLPLRSSDNEKVIFTSENRLVTIDEHNRKSSSIINPGSEDESHVVTSFESTLTSVLNKPLLVSTKLVNTKPLMPIAATIVTSSITGEPRNIDCLTNHRKIALPDDSLLRSSHATGRNAKLVTEQAPAKQFDSFTSTHDRSTVTNLIGNSKPTISPTNYVNTKEPTVVVVTKVPVETDKFKEDVGTRLGGINKTNQTQQTSFAGQKFIGLVHTTSIKKKQSSKYLRAIIKGESANNNQSDNMNERWFNAWLGRPLINATTWSDMNRKLRMEGESKDEVDKNCDYISNCQDNVLTKSLPNTMEKPAGKEEQVESRYLNASLSKHIRKGQSLWKRERRLSFNTSKPSIRQSTPRPFIAERDQIITDLKSTMTISDARVMDNQSDDSLSRFGNFYTTSWNLSTDQQQTRQQTRHHSENLTKVIAAIDQWPVKHSAVVEGDLVLGGLMMVHEREDSHTCGPVMPQGGIQALEAMLYSLDRLNVRDIVPGVTIGAHILDDCDKDTYGLEMAVDFIKGSISNIDGAEYHCNKTAVRKVISGVVGAASSVTSIQVANLLRLFRIPQVSFFSTSPELSNKQRFEYFTRTIPSDHYQVKAMVEIIKQMNWTYVSVIYEESNYGVKAFEELESLLAKNEICIAVKEKLVKDSGVADESVYDSIVQKLLTKRRARGCIIYGSDQEVAGLMKAVRRCNATGAFSWIGSDGWSARGLVSDGNEAEVEGTLSVQPQANPVEGFEEYFLNLTVENNKRNPWFVEFWEDHFKCRYPNSTLTPYNKYENYCTTKERLNKGDMAFENQLQFVSDAVMAFAYAFRDMHRDLCHGQVGLCDDMKPTKGEELLKYLRKVDFQGLSGDRFKFDNNGDGPARYNIIHFKQTSAGQYKWIRVGKYLEGILHLNMTEVQFRLEHAPPPESVCSLPCELGQAKKYVEGESCCWHCFNCTQYQIRKPDDETQCIDCPEGTVPDDTHSYCRDIPEEFLKLESGWAIGAMSFSSTGILVTFFVGGVFLKHNDTPIVRASGRELSYILLSGILLCYLVTFALVLRPTDIVCGIQRFAAGFCFTVVYAALLTKTNRISRIFRAGKHSAKRPSFISPRSQLIICSMLVFVQILINGVWMVIDPAKAMHHYPTREDNLLVCNSYIDASYMIAFTYPIILIIVCTVYAVLTRKIPEAFNESKHIGFTMYTTCVIWLAFVPLYFGTGNHVALRITSMSVTISLSASVTIACLFSPKLYIILIRPERNVRQSMMPNRHSTTKTSAVTGTNASSMMAPITLTAVTCDQNKTLQRHVTTTMDCSTQSEYYEMSARESQNGKPKAALVSASTQTQHNNNKTDSISSQHTISNESLENVTKMVNNSKIGNGPLSQNDITL